MQIDVLNNSFKTSNPRQNIITLDSNDEALIFDLNPYNAPIGVQDQEKGFIIEKDFPTINKNESTFLISEEINHSVFNSQNEKENKISNKNVIKKLKHYGNTVPILFDKQGEVLIVIGPHCKIKFNQYRRAFFHLLINCFWFSNLFLYEFPLG